MAMRSLTAVFAHPDDESFGAGGTLARYADEGVDIHLICATRGEVGDSQLEDLGGCEDLACQREKELRCATGTLGVAQLHLLGYRDSGMAGTPANEHPQALMQADLDVVAERIAALIADIDPDVLLTFDPFGGYGHPDHIATHQAAVKAFELLDADERPKRMYFTTFNPAALRWSIRLLPLFGKDPEAVGTNGDINLREIAEHQLPPTTRIDIREYVDQKRQAQACHASQMSGSGSFWDRLPKWLVRRWQAWETYHRAFPPFEGRGLEDDLFEDL